MPITPWFFKTLVSYLLRKAAEPAIEHGLSIVDDELRKLSEPVPPDDWDGEPLTEEQKRLVAMLPALQGDVSNLTRVWAWLRKPQRRGIVILGPSGSGKSQIALRLRGKSPTEDGGYTIDAEERGLVVSGRHVPMIDTPGESRHAHKGYGDVLDAMTGKHPPSLAIVVVAGGYLATAAPEYRGSYLRPGSMAEPVGSNTHEYLEASLEEEASYLLQLVDHCQKHVKKSEPMPRARLQGIITVVNKRDLWAEDGASEERIVERYADETSTYGAALATFRKAFGAPDAHSHDVLPLFTHGGGFHPDSTRSARALTPFHAAVDALVLRTLVSYRYTGGGVLD